MRTVIRSFLHVMARFKMATFLNIAGLSVAFAAFFLIMVQVGYDRGFDRFHEDSECIYRLEYMNRHTLQSVMSRPLADLFIQSSPHINSGTVYEPWTDDMVFSIVGMEKEKDYKETSQCVDEAFADVFHFEMTEGLASALKEPDKVLIPESMARRLFGNAPAIGHQLRGASSYTIGGVYQDFPANSTIGNNIYYPLGNDKNRDSWGNNSFSVFLRFDSPQAAEGSVEQFKQRYEQELGWEKSERDLRLTALGDLHYTTDVQYDYTPKSSRQTVWILFTIALLIILIAGINFTNFSSALAPLRIKSINTQKVLGSPDRTLRRMLLSEAVLVSMISFLFGLLIVHAFSLSDWASLVEGELGVERHISLVATLFGVSVLVGVLAGLYPSYYMTSFSPALVLKGSFSLSPKGRQLRNVLVGVQYVASFVLIVGALFLYLQNYYMRYTTLGYNQDAVIVAKMNAKVLNNQEAFINQLRSSSDVEDVTTAFFLLSSSDQYLGWSRSFRDQEITFQCLPVSYNFLRTLEIKVEEGRDFRQGDTAIDGGVLIFNEKARKEYDLRLGDKVHGSEIVGFIPDIKFASFRTEVAPMAFYLHGPEMDTFVRYAYVKIRNGVDMGKAMHDVKATLDSFDPSYPFDVCFLDEVMNDLYDKELRLGTLISLFSFIAVLISVVGVFGLVVFETQYRRKEIGIRKVHGATVREILVLFNRVYMRIVLVCFVIATPVAWYGVKRWLDSFAYRTPVYWWVFMLALLILLTITFMTVSFQSWKAANANPVDSIKSE